MSSAMQFIYFLLSIVSILTTPNPAFLSNAAKPPVDSIHRPPKIPQPLPVQRFYLGPDQLRQLHFKPTVNSIQLSEGHETKFNCSIDIPDPRVEPTILWMKNGQDLAANGQVVINELQTITDGVATLLSTVRCVRHHEKALQLYSIHLSSIYCLDMLLLMTMAMISPLVLYYSINYVQRVDAGEYRCRLSVANTLVESSPIIIEVNGGFHRDAHRSFILFLKSLNAKHTFDFLQVYPHLSVNPRTGTSPEIPLSH